MSRIFNRVLCWKKQSCSAQKILEKRRPFVHVITIMNSYYFHYLLNYERREPTTIHGNYSSGRKLNEVDTKNSAETVFHVFVCYQRFVSSAMFVKTLRSWKKFDERPIYDDIVNGGRGWRNETKGWSAVILWIKLKSWRSGRGRGGGGGGTLAPWAPRWTSHSYTVQFSRNSYLMASPFPFPETAILWQVSGSERYSGAHKQNFAGVQFRGNQNTRENESHSKIYTLTLYLWGPFHPSLWFRPHLYLAPCLWQMFVFPLPSYLFSCTLT